MTQPRRGRGRRATFRLLTAMFIAVAMLGLGTRPAQADPNPIEEMSTSPGPYAVVWDEDANFDDDVCVVTQRPSAGFTIVYPTPLGFPDGDHPVVVWANGTDVVEAFGFGGLNTTCTYERLLRHIASWGFVVIAPNDGQTGSGDEVKRAVEVADWLDADPSPTNIFRGKLETEHIAAAGHSQGAVGVINAARTTPAGVIDSVLALSMPDKGWLDWANTNLFPRCKPFCQDVVIPDDATNDLNVPIFFARGTGLQNPGCVLDDYLSDQTHVDWRPSDATVPYVFGTVEVPPPADVARCNPPTSYPFIPPIADLVFPHPVDLYPHASIELLDRLRGYSTAWLIYTLTCFGNADDAFTGTTPEIIQNSRWNPPPTTHHPVIRNNLPSCP